MTGEGLCFPSLLRDLRHDPEVFGQIPAVGKRLTGRLYHFTHSRFTVTACQCIDIDLCLQLRDTFRVGV